MRRAPHAVQPTLAC